MNIVEALKHTNLFFDLSSTQLANVASFVRELTVAQGETIFDQNSAGRDLYVVLHGGVEVSVATDAEDTVLATFSANQSFGEMAMVDEGRRSATARAVEDDTLLLVIDTESLMRQCQADTDMGFRIMRHIATDLTLRVRKLDLHFQGQLFWGATGTDLSKLF